MTGATPAFEASLQVTVQSTTFSHLRVRSRAEGNKCELLTGEPT